MEVNLQLGVHDHQGEAEHIGGTAHVLLHQKHGGSRLDIEAAGVEAYALADQGDLAVTLLAPAHLDEAGSYSRGAADGMNEWEVLFDQLVAGDDGDIGLVVFGQTADGGFEIGRAHVVGRRVDQIPGEKDAGNLALDVGGIGILGDEQARFRDAFGAIAVEAIGAEAIAEEKAVGGKRRRLDMPLTGRQGAGELAGQIRVFRGVGAEAEECATDMGISCRDQEDRTWLGLEAGLLCPIESERLKRAGFDMGRGDGEDRQRLSALGAEGGRSFDVLERGHDARFLGVALRIAGMLD